MIGLIKWIITVGVFLFPLLYFGGFAYPIAVSHALFAFLLSEVVIFLYLWHGFRSGRFEFRKSGITLALLIYMGVLFIAAVFGADFMQSFWSSYPRMTGLLTWLHCFALFFVMSAVFKDTKDWRPVFRATALSGAVLAFVSWFGINGFNWSVFSHLTFGGSLLGNTSYNGAYLVLVFLFSTIGLYFENAKPWKYFYAASLILIFFNPDLFNIGVFTGKIHLIDAVVDPSLLFGMARASTGVLWLSVFMMSVILFVHKFRSKTETVIASIVLMFVVGAGSLYVISSVFSGGGFIHDKYFTGSGGIRPITWSIAVEGIKDRPIFGYGPENFNYLYDRHLDVRMLSEDIPFEEIWQDKAHNFVLDEVAAAGFAGLLAVFGVFAMSAYVSFKLYMTHGRPYFLMLPFILFIHFLQLQTFFQTNSSLFIIFIIFAFIVSHEEQFGFRVFSKKREWLTAGLFGLFVVALYNFAYIPAKQNLIMSSVTNEASFERREMLLAGALDHRVYPVATLNFLSTHFVGAFSGNVKRAYEIGIGDKVANEAKAYLDIYESYMPRFKDNYRFLVDYANLTNVAYIYGVNELDKGKFLLEESVKISNAYPHPYWLLALNRYYAGEKDKALEYARYAADNYPVLDAFQPIYNLVKGS